MNKKVMGATQWANISNMSFEAVVVACGDSDTAAIIDRAVNTVALLHELDREAQIQSHTESCQVSHWQNSFEDIWRGI